ncbi:MAG: DAK2 domain-containing protein [Lachnospiraceae bacterium]|nr:DAK2 domain-containing protein [Lachnospiraceae bacterium]
MNTIDAQLFAKMFLAGAKNLESKKEWINELNVFPVPDGDTGTNMTMTIMSAAREIADIDEPNLENLSKAISSGSLRGARGNSGVILSQLFRGFTKAIRDKEAIDVPLMAVALEKAVETAYKAVMKPKEGTILTVARGVSVKARELADAGCEDMAELLAAILAEAEVVLEQTPELLPVLKQAGVVDSGGQGFVEVLRGWNDAYNGVEIDYTLEESAAAAAKAEPVQEEVDIKFGYCTEFIILLERPLRSRQEKDLKEFLESIGDSIVMVADDDIVKVHVHTNDPGMALQRALTYGQLSNMKIDNMRLEHKETLFKKAEKEAGEKAAVQVPEEPRKDVGFIAVSVGDGLNEIFESLGADQIITGGQTMNPSTEDILKAVDKVNADHIFILPNNSNIILAANQAKSLVKDKDIIVIPTKTIPQGITAMISFVPEMSIEENVENITSEIGAVKTGEVTYAVRDTTIDDKEIKCGDYMGIDGKTVLSVGADVTQVTLEMVNAMVDESTELISLYYGEDVSPEDAQKLSDRISELHADCDVEMQRGGQPIYYYIVSAE